MGIFIPDPTRPHLRYPWDFAREAERVEQARKDYRDARARGDIVRALAKWSMTLAKRHEVETAHQHLIAQVRLAKADVMGRLESGDRDWDGLRKSLHRYIEFQTGADVISGQTPLER